MQLTKAVQQFLDKSPVSLIAGSGGPLSKGEIKEFFDNGIAPDVKNKKYGRICYAGLLMAQDYIWEAHEIVQDYSDTTASWWHAFMHRMEGDYGNSAYWYRRVGSPEQYSQMTAVIAGLDLPDELSQLQEGDWDPFKFNSMIEKYQGSSIQKDLESIHRLEWSLLFKISVQGAC